MNQMPSVTEIDVISPAEDFTRNLHKYQEAIAV